MFKIHCLVWLTKRLLMSLGPKSNFTPVTRTKKRNIIKRIIKKLRGENPNDEKIHARRAAPDAPKRPNDPLQIDPNSKVIQGAAMGKTKVNLTKSRSCNFRITKRDY